MPISRLFCCLMWKKWPRSFLSFCALLLISYTSFSYDHQKVDSLKKKLYSSERDTNRVDILINLASLLKDDSSKTALIFAEEALGLSRELKYQSGIPSSYNNIGIIYTVQGDYATGLKYFFKELKFYEEIEDEEGITIASNSIAIIHGLMGNESKSLEYFLKALEFAEKSGHKKQIATLNNNVGIIYKDMGSDTLAIRYAYRALGMYQELGDQAGIGKCYNNLGEAYEQQGNFDQALEMQLKALEIDGGNMYTLVGIGDLYLKKKYAAKAVNYYNRVVEHHHETGYMIKIQDAYQGLAKAHEMMGDYQKAFKYQQFLTAIKDSIFSEKSSSQIADMETKYQTEKKEQEIAFLEKENEVKALELEKEETFRFFMVGGFLFILAVSFLLYNRHRLKQKKDSLEEKQVLLNQINKHQESLINAIVNAQEGEREHIARELHSGLGGLLSTVRELLDDFKNKYVPAKEGDEAILSKSISLVNDVRTDLKAISRNMIPGVLVRKGLRAAIKDYIGKVSLAGSFELHFESVGNEERLEGTVEIELYRVIQESINNSIKYAEAKEVTIKIMQDEQQFNVVVEDDGKGFNVNELGEENGIGLKNMKSRITHLGGKVEIDSKPDKGTKVIIDLPI